jgi:hypothetical protein
MDIEPRKGAMRIRGQWITSRRIEAKVQAAHDRAMRCHLHFHCRML